eukprot:TRINITY_DN55788_c0_g1_i1.p1 TRINITY_DN55788_c0_g1~~TRINITY_DN55788_c0_g1_i1.p1  ORF type:complete len:161 (-),score=24.45 TRINITY_DN55788_c0_g1_i1:130-612(-)
MTESLEPLTLTLEKDHILWLGKPAADASGAADDDGSPGASDPSAAFRRILVSALCIQREDIFGKVRGSHMRYRGASCTHEPNDPAASGPKQDLQPVGGAMKEKVNVEFQVSPEQRRFLEDAAADPAFKLADISKAARVVMEWAMVERTDVGDSLESEVQS